MVAIGVGIQGHPTSPSGAILKSDYKIVGNPSFTDAVSAISTLVFTYAGTPAFFNIAAEMRDPRQYNRSLAVCQITVTTVYIVIGTVVYIYCGSHVASPALGSAGQTVKMVSYGIALPGLTISAALLIHVRYEFPILPSVFNTWIRKLTHVQLPAKHIFVRILRRSKHLTSHTPIHWITWIGSTFSVSLVAYLVASGIPIFGGLVSLIGALLGAILSFQPMGCMWLYDNWKKENRNLRWRGMVAWCAFVILSGTFLMISGTYGAIVGIIDSYKQSGGSAAWSCADNSNSS